MSMMQLLSIAILEMTDFGGSIALQHKIISTDLDLRFTSEDIFCNGRLWGEQKRTPRKEENRCAFLRFCSSIFFQWTAPYVFLGRLQSWSTNQSP